MHFLAKFKNILYMGFKATLNFRKNFLKVLTLRVSKILKKFVMVSPLIKFL